MKAMYRAPALQDVGSFRERTHGFSFGGFGGFGGWGWGWGWGRGWGWGHGWGWGRGWGW
ncbi:MULTISPECIES: lasso RiPP family leader peptide-containing protein [unclassified Pseudofrankia]|uniref:lasso RiPP family leader peptide-containing protein n=1 Tax=unclassified Pseudofrankia TaxID=2994372 RepID=UPI000E2A30E3|nr:MULTISPECIES: lasso RiPP family leader peptide-containing protein [unclassified Pseudofrankia]MDT3441790.1 lasso RiPP family leader peptide-containing protein [Pseudofrankia sp. BMG5.37]